MNRTDFQNCTRCGASLSAGAKFCHACGDPTSGGTAGAPKGSGALLPWAILGTTLAALAVVVAWYVDSQNRSPEPAGPAEVAATPSEPAVDLGDMSPREIADRLYSRVLVAAAHQDSAELAFFKDKTISSFLMLGELDADARFRLGLVYALTGEVDAALAQADTLEADRPAHLLGTVIRQRVAALAADSARMMRTYRTFVDAFDSEIAASLPEYQANLEVLDAFRAEATRAVGD